MQEFNYINIVVWHANYAGLILYLCPVVLIVLLIVSITRLRRIRTAGERSGFVLHIWTRRVGVLALLWGGLIATWEIIDASLEVLRMADPYHGFFFGTLAFTLSHLFLAFLFALLAYVQSYVFDFLLARKLKRLSARQDKPEDVELDSWQDGNTHADSPHGP